MFRRSVAVGAAVAVVALSAGVAAAGSGTVGITTPTGTTYVAKFPATRTVTVDFEHDDGGKGLCGLDWTITVSGPSPSSTSVGSWSGTFPQLEGTGANKTCAVGSTESVSRDVEIPSKGTYTVYAALATPGHTGSDTETAEFLVEESSDVRYDFRAAPAVANSLLKGTDVKGRDRGTCVKAVAEHMGPRTDFDEVKKSEVGEYKSVVDAFLSKTCGGYTGS
jgi:hypothetical protein